MQKKIRLISTLIGNMKWIIELLKLASIENLTNLWLDTKNEFVKFTDEQLAGYYEYDRQNPNRFVVKYDENLNRIW